MFICMPYFIKYQLLFNFLFSILTVTITIYCLERSFFFSLSQTNAAIGTCSGRPLNRDKKRSVRPFPTAMATVGIHRRCTQSSSSSSPQSVLDKHFFSRDMVIYNEITFK